MTRQDQVQPADDAKKQVPDAGATVKPEAPPGGAPRRAPAAKEIIPLAWKLIGTSAGTPVTLLKCIERKDAEAQMARLETEGYYQHLKIYPAEEKVSLSGTLARARKKVIDEAVNLAGARKAASAPAKDASEGTAKNTASKRSAAAASQTIMVRTKPIPVENAAAKTKAKSKAKAKAPSASPARKKTAAARAPKEPAKKKSAKKRPAAKKPAKAAKPPAKAATKSPKKKAVTSKKAAKVKKTTRRRK